MRGRILLRLWKVLEGMHDLLHFIQRDGVAAVGEGYGRECSLVAKCIELVL